MPRIIIPDDDFGGRGQRGPERKAFFRFGVFAAPIILVVALVAAVAGTFAGLVRVGPGQVAILIKKTGKDLPPGAIVAPGPEYKGIQEEVLTEGWHFRNPYIWDSKNASQVEIPAGKVGVKIRQFGDPLPAGQVIAGEKQKGIQKDVLSPGRWAINTELYTVQVEPAIEVPAGWVGIQTILRGKESKDPNRFLVEEGERGLQKGVLPPGTHYVNPFEVWVDPISLQSHRFDMIDKDAIEFPSKDGFQIKMEATVEWYIDPAQVARVFAEYVDARAFADDTVSNDEVIKAIVEKIILPNARSYSRLEGSKHPARDFMGETREKFQQQFLKDIEVACGSQGIVIKSALVRKTAPPEEIATPIRNREIAIRQRENYLQKIEREKQEKQLAMEKKLQERSAMLNKAQADVSVSITEADRQKEVALIQADRRLEVARLELEATRNQAEAIVALGKAEADVVRLKNAAEASGIKAAREAFGGGEAFVSYLFRQKVAPAIQYILSNTDGPFVDLFREMAPDDPAKAAEPAPRPAGPE